MAGLRSVLRVSFFHPTLLQLFILCHLDMTKANMYTYFIDNQQALTHRSVVFGLRELNATETADACSSSAVQRLPITDQRMNFTANYELRTYTSGCYYLDSKNQWQADGVVVGALTDHYQTQCFSTHLTTFAGGFIVLPAPVNWNYVFANADFAKNKTIYITLMVICVLYILLVIFARLKDRKDLQKVRVDRRFSFITAITPIASPFLVGRHATARQSEE